ncbi:MAG: hypothetical protein LBQ22_05650 [Bacteroidales bacterium]|nr:hypothetical protein [Bacteroidales bacterium]
MRVQSTKNNEALFCLNDVCTVLGLSNVTETKKRLQKKGLSSIEVPTSGGRQKMLFIDEPNLYRCIFQSRKKEAESFQDWVVEEVLPQIRKTGGYSVRSVKLRQAADVYPIKEFKSPYGWLRATTVENEVMFCYIDICRAIGVKNGTSLKNKLNLNGFRYIETPTGGGIQVLSYIDEPNLSRIFSRKVGKEITILQGWIESEVLTVMRSEPNVIEAKQTEIIPKTEAIPETIPMKLCPELAEIIGGACIVIQQLERYKTLAGIRKENVIMNVATSSLNLVKDALATLYQEAYIKDLERKVLK